MKRRQESQIDLNGRNRDEERTKKRDSAIKSVGKIKREIRSVKRLLSRVEVYISTLILSVHLTFSEIFNIVFYGKTLSHMAFLKILHVKTAQDFTASYMVDVKFNTVDVKMLYPQGLAADSCSRERTKTGDVGKQASQHKTVQSFG